MLKFVLLLSLYIVRVVLIVKLFKLKILIEHHLKGYFFVIKRFSFIPSTLVILITLVQCFVFRLNGLFKLFNDYFLLIFYLLNFQTFNLLRFYFHFKFRFHFSSFHFSFNVTFCHWFHFNRLLMNVTASCLFFHFYWILLDCFAFLFCLHHFHNFRGGQGRAILELSKEHL